MLRLRRWAALLLCVLMAVSMTGCKDDNGKGKEELPTSEGFTNDVVMRVGGQEVSYAEANIYLQSMQEEVEALYGADIWDFVFTSEGETYKEMMKDELLNKIIYIKLVCYMADEFDVSLEADDILNVNDYTQEFLSGITEETAKTYGITEELIRGIYTDNVLAEKIYRTITLNADTSYSEEEVLHAAFYYVKLNKFYEDLEGNQVPVTEEDRQKIAQNANTIRQAGLEAEDFYSFAKEKTEAASVEMIVGRSDLPAASRAAAFALKEGQISAVVEEEDGFYIFYCKSERDDVATREAEEEKIEELSRKYFDGLYAKWVENVKVEVNEALWNAMGK